MYTVDISERMPRKLFGGCSLGERSFACLCVIINMLLSVHMCYSFVFGCAGSPLLRKLSMMAANGSYSLVGCERPSHCGDLSHCGTLALGHRLNGCDARAQLLHVMRDPSGSEIEPMSPALAGRLFITQGSAICITFIVEKID